jgi:hypothetical protein
VRRHAKPVDAGKSRLQRLADRIELLAKRDEIALTRAREILDLRHQAAHGLHSMCSQFVASVNELLGEPVVQLDPPEMGPVGFHEDGSNLLQISVRGRILQVEFQATEELLSTEDFRVPYTLEGTVRAFNQSLLERQVIEEQLLFYTLERHREMWRFFDARTYRTGPFDREYLISLMEEIV